MANDNLIGVRYPNSDWPPPLRPEEWPAPPAYRENTVDRAFITGVTGQVGSYMADYLLNKGYFVIGLDRRKSVNNHRNIEHLKYKENFKLVEGDLTDTAFINNYFTENKFTEIYHLAAQSHVHTSFKQPKLTFETNTIGTLNLLEAIRLHMPKCKMYNASTSEMYGSSKPPQNMQTVFHPRSPYGCAKLASHWLLDVYRDSYNLKVASGVMFNTESPRRGDEFVTKKIINYVKKYYQASLNNEEIKPLELGNLDAYRDWSHVKDSVEAIYRICNQDQYRPMMYITSTNLKFDNPEIKYKDYTFGSGKSMKIRDFLKKALDFAFREPDRFVFRGSGLEEQVFDVKLNKNAVVVSSEFFRPAEVDYLQADPTEIKNQLGWEPRISLDDLVADMFMSGN